MQAWVSMQWHFIVTLSLYLGMINANLFNEYTVYYFYVFFCVITTNKNFPGLSTSTTHLNSSSQPTNTTMSVTLTTQPTKISQTTRSTTASSVTSSQLNITVVTTSKISFTSVTGEFTFQEARKGLYTH